VLLMTAKNCRLVGHHDTESSGSSPQHWLVPKCHDSGAGTAIHDVQNHIASTGRFVPPVAYQWPAGADYSGN
jgi:hypothetical protein